MDITLIMMRMLERGFIYALPTMSTYLTSRVIKFDDLSIDGSFGLGGALTAWAMMHNIHPAFGLALSIVAGMFSGLCTGLLHTRLYFNNLISGIIISTALFSVNLKIAGETALLNPSKVLLQNPFLNNFEINFGGLITCATIIFIILYWFLRTDFGLIMYATGDNPRRVSLLGKYTSYYIILNLMIANGINALAGSLLVHYAGYFSIWQSIGILVTCLASLVISEIISKKFSIALIIGSIIYQGILIISYALHHDTELNRLYAALLIIFIMMFQKKSYPFSIRRY